MNAFILFISLVAAFLLMSLLTVVVQRIITVREDNPSMKDIAKDIAEQFMSAVHPVQKDVTPEEPKKKATKT